MTDSPSRPVGRERRRSRTSLEREARAWRKMARESHHPVRFWFFVNFEMTKEMRERWRQHSALTTLEPSDPTEHSGPLASLWLAEECDAEARHDA